MPYFSRGGTSGGSSRGVSRGVPRGAPGTNLRGASREVPRGAPGTNLRGASRRNLGETPGGTQGGISRRFPIRRRLEREVSKEKPKDTSFFGKGEKDEISRTELKSILKKTPSKIGSKNKIYSEEYRVGLEKKIGKRAGFYISKRDVKDHIKKLKDDSFKAKTWKEKKGVKDEIDVWKKLGGIK